LNLILGENHNKICPEKAAEMMKLAGSAAGMQRYPTLPFMRANEGGVGTFKYVELFDEYQLKGYSGKKSEYFLGMIEGLEGKKKRKNSNEKEELEEDNDWMDCE
jgi:hypothetical protein